MSSSMHGSATQSISIQGTYMSTCCVVGNGAMCYTRSSTSSSDNCNVPTCDDLASGDASRMNGFKSLRPAATAQNPNPQANASASNLTYSNYKPDGAGGNGAGILDVKWAHVAGIAGLTLAGLTLL